MLFIFLMLFTFDFESKHCLFSTFLFFLLILFLFLFGLFLILSLIFVYLLNANDSAQSKTKLLTKTFTFLDALRDCLLVGFWLLILMKSFTYSAFHSKFCKVIPGFANILSTKYPIFSTLLTAIVISWVTVKPTLILWCTHKYWLFSDNLISWFNSELSSINNLFAFSFLLSIIITEIFGEWRNLFNSGSSWINSTGKAGILSFNLQCDFNIIFVLLILMVNEKDKSWVRFLLFCWYYWANHKKDEKHQKDTILHLNSINIKFAENLKIINAAIILSSFLTLIFIWKLEK